MNVANLELSRELYKLSGWYKATEKFWFYDDNFGYQLVDRPFGKLEKENGNRCPAYDAGFMLRKLPAKIIDGIDDFFLKMSKNDDNDYTFAYVCEMANLYGTPSADTPENALALLAINLFKQGILTQEGVNNHE